MVAPSTTPTAPLQAARELAPWIREVADEIDFQRELPTELANAIADAGLFRMLVPKSLGGGELDPSTHIQVIEEIAKADGSTAWCVNQGAVFATHSAYLEPDAAYQIWGENPRSVVANGPAPLGAEAEVVEDGYRVTGRWTFSSGCRHATWLAGIATIVENGQKRRLPNGEPEVRLMLLPKTSANVLDTWDVRGLRGTGSHHFTVDDLFVPQAHTVMSHTDPVRESGPLYRYPIFLHFASGFASVSLGIARTALDALIELAGGKTPRGQKHTMRDQALVQSQIGRAEATWRAARAYLHQTVGDVWEAVSTSHKMTLEQRIQLRLATTHTIRMAAETVDIVYNASGVNAIYGDHIIQRCFQDIHVVTQHIQGRLTYYELVGQYFLGLDIDKQWL